MRSTIGDYYEPGLEIVDSKTVTSGSLNLEFHADVSDADFRVESKISFEYEYLSEKNNGTLKIDIQDLKVKDYQGNSVNVKIKDDDELFDGNTEVADKFKELINNGYFDKQIIRLITGE